MDMIKFDNFFVIVLVAMTYNTDFFIGCDPDN